MTALTPRRPLTAETELRGHLAHLRRAVQDELIARLYAEHDAHRKTQVPQATVPAQVPRGPFFGDDRCGYCGHTRTQHDEATVEHACLLSGGDLRCGCVQFVEPR